MGLSTGTDATFIMIRGLKKDGSDGRVRFQKSGEESPANDAPTSELLRKLEGDFQSVTFKDKPRVDEKGKEHPRRVFSLKLQDGNETYILGCAFNSLGRNILNSLISKTQHGRLMFSLYEKDGKPRIGIFTKDADTQDDMLSWSMSMEESDKLVIKTELPDGTIHYSYNKLDEYLEKQASLLTPRDTDVKFGAEAVTKPKAKSKKKIETPDDDGDLPF